MNWFRLFLALAVAGTLPAIAQNAPIEITEIKSDGILIKGKADHNIVTFSGNVRISATNLEATCDEMEIIAIRSVGGEDKSSEDDSFLNQIGGVRSLVAKGNVYILQSGRTVQGDSAKILPLDGYLEVTGDARYSDDSGVNVSGWRITLKRGERSVNVERNPAVEGNQVRTALPPIQDLGVDLEKLMRAEDEVEQTEEGSSENE